MSQDFAHTSTHYPEPEKAQTGPQWSTIGPNKVDNVFHYLYQ